MRLRQRDELIVGVDRLRGLAGQDRDRRQRRDQAAGIEHAVDDRQHVLVHGDPLVQRAEREQVVDAQRAVPFERVRRRLHVEVLLEVAQIVVEGVDEIGLDRVFDDRVALLGDFLDVQFEFRVAPRCVARM